MVSNTDDNDKIKEKVADYSVEIKQKTLCEEPLANHDLLNWIENTTSDVFIIWNKEGHLVYTSKSIERLLGYESQQVSNISWNSFLDEKEAHFIKQNFDATSQEQQVFNINIKHKSDKHIWCECTVKKIMKKNNEEYFFTTLKDMTEKKEMEEMMVRSEKMSIAGQLAAGVAHEIRNPLTSIKGFLQLLQAGMDRKEEYYKIMIDEIEKMETITSEMLFISKPLTNNLQEENVSDMIDDVITLLVSQAKKKGIEILQKKDIDSFIYCDKSQVKQVLINLMKNAIEAMNVPGTITVTNETKTSFVEINIIDEGEGIPEEVIHKLGEPFFTTKQHGTGLGLMITKQILAKHNATMDIFQNKDKGSTFSLKFLIDP